MWQNDQPDPQRKRLEESIPSSSEVQAKPEELELDNHKHSVGFDSSSLNTIVMPGRFNTHIGANSAEGLPGMIGKYRLINLIGEGGMGSVWSAEQNDPVKRCVAVKLIRADRGNSATILARFDAERQAIALMEHPHIAKLLDAGTTDYGCPFFVMELVKGIAVTEFCDRQKLSLAERLKLFIQICGAVQHAHQKGIIHRDLKPSNILVESHEGKLAPKVIDFGLAKATNGLQLSEHSQYTACGSVLGTPLYMAPEQADLNAVDIDTRADIFSLGVIFYELLTGTTPLTQELMKKAALDEVLRLIREQEAPTPSSRLKTSNIKQNIAANRHTEPARLGRSVRGELDWITLKALAKERERRYETANAFAKDIERFLNHEPVQAGPPSKSYRFQKFVQRNRGQVIAASMVLATLLLGMVGTSIGYIRAERAFANESLAKKDADKQRDAKDLALKAEMRANEELWAGLDAMTADIVGDSIGSQTEINDEQKTFLDTVLPLYRNLAEKSGLDRTVRLKVAKASFRVGMIQSQLGRKAEGRAAMLGARDDFEKLVAEFPAELDIRVSLASSHANLGILQDGDEAVNSYRAALALEELLVADLPDAKYSFSLAVTQANLGTLLRDLGQVAEAEKQHRAALAILEKLAGDFPSVHVYRDILSITHNQLGVLLCDLGQVASAEKEHQAALALRKTLVKDFPSSKSYRDRLADSQKHFGDLLRTLGRGEEAEKQYRAALSLREKLAAEFPAMPVYSSSLAASHNNFGALLQGLGRDAEAEKHYRAGLALCEKLAAEFPGVPEYRISLSGSHNNIGLFLAERGEGKEAEKQYRAALVLQEELAGEFPTVLKYRAELAGTHNNLGLLLSELGQTDEAGKQYLACVAIQKVLAAESPTVLEYSAALAKSLNCLGVLLTNLGQLDEAETQYRAALVLQEQLVAEFPFMIEYQVDLGGSCCNFGHLLRDRGQTAESLDWFNKAIVTLRIVHKDEPRAMTAKRYLSNSHGGRALAHEQLKEYAAAIEDWDFVLELSSPNERRIHRAHRANILLLAGKMAEAIAEVESLTQWKGWNANQWYDFACIYAVSANNESAPKQVYNDKAASILAQAVQAGYRDAEHIKKDIDLDLLRTREDVQKLISLIEAKNHIPMEVSPMRAAEE